MEDHDTKLTPYNGIPIKSFTDKITIKDQIILNKCSFNYADNLQNVKIIVTENQIGNDKCIVGRDFMKRIPEFDDKITTLEKTINYTSNDVIKRFNKLKETISSNEQD
jgi:hypothetical protein